MQFNSLTFFIFLGATLCAVRVAKHFFGHRPALFALVLASFVYYSWDNYYLCLLLLASILVNNTASKLISSETSSQAINNKLVLIIAISLNLLTLVFFKYTNFIISNINEMLENPIAAINVILPIGISFFTFQQITFLIDCYQKRASTVNFLDYLLFVSFFPQLMSGPIVRHYETLPQFANIGLKRDLYSNLAAGLSLITFGLFKKVILADFCASYADFTFLHGYAQGPAVAWLGALAYTLQIYFDFSGYIDIAIGTAYTFGVRLPINFSTPYRATSIISFWRRWHITLARFFRDYVYIPMGGNRLGIIRSLSNLLIVMFLVGLWHGANWTFVVWGLLHGAYLVINHVWRNFKGTTPSLSDDQTSRSNLNFIRKALAWSVTFIAVIFAWVPFRANDLTETMKIWQTMLEVDPARWSAGIDYIAASVAKSSQQIYDSCFALITGTHHGSVTSFTFIIFPEIWILISIIFVFFIPDSTQLFGRLMLVDPKNKNNLGPIESRWQPTAKWAITMGIIFILCFVNFGLNKSFIYFQF